MSLTRRARIASLVAYAAYLAACTSPEDPPALADSVAACSSGAAVYPVDPQVHVTDDHLDARDPGSIHATVLNPVAYARHALELSIGWRVESETSRDIAIGIADSSTFSGIAPTDLVRYALVTPSVDEIAAAWAAMNVAARGGSATSPVPRVIERSLGAEWKRRACEADGHAAASCCRALLLPAALLDDPASWSSEQRAHLDEQAAQGFSFARTLTEERLSADPDQPFQLLGVKAWLSACAGEVADRPATLAALRALVGDYRTWGSELHPISMAKLAGRRIYRRGNTSVAESLNADCSVRETEVVRKRWTGLVDMWSYDAEGRPSLHGYFPAAPNRDAIKPTPDACMGCHYTFDTRRFEVRVPSYQALRLELRSQGGVPVWRDDSACALPDEPLIWHATP